MRKSRKNKTVIVLSPSDSLNKILIEQIKIINRSIHPDYSPEKSVHEIRKAVKRLRSIARPGKSINPEVFQSWNSKLRDLSRQIAHSREITVHIATAMQLSNPRIRQELRDFLVYRRNEIYTELLNTNLLNNTANSILEVIDSNRIIIPDYLPLNLMTREIINGYKHAKNQFDIAENSNDPIEYHELRKKLKRLQYQLIILNDLKAIELSRFRSKVEIFTELLGHHNDVSELIQYLKNTGYALNHMKIIEHLHDIMIQSRKKAIAEGSEVLRDSTEEFSVLVQVTISRHYSVPII